MNPIKTKESNFVYRGPTSEINDLHCRIEEGATFSTWELSDEDRRLIAAGAHIRLGIHGVRPIPPVSLSVVVNAAYDERIPAPCSVCGKELEDAVHMTGEGTHAYRAGSSKS